MARVAVDASVIGDAWFRSIIPEITRLAGIQFVRSLDPITTGEHERAKKLGEFYNILSRMGKVLCVDRNAAANHITYLENLPEWRKEKSCDDPHLFAATHERNIRYIFTAETRLAVCRDCINKVVDKRYCSFSLIRSLENYTEHKSALSK